MSATHLFAIPYVSCSSNLGFCVLNTLKHGDRLLADRYHVSHPLKMGSTPTRTEARAGTRIPCEIPITLSSLDPARPFSEPGWVILANLRGCAMRLGRPVAVGVAVRLQSLPATTNVTARVVNCISFGEHAKFWLLGLALDEPGNVWGIEASPEDWVR